MSSINSTQAASILGRKALEVYLHCLPPVNTVIFYVDKDDGNEPFKVKGYSIKTSGITVWGHYKSKKNISISLSSFSSNPSGRIYGELDVFSTKPLKDYIKKGKIRPKQERIKNQPILTISKYQLYSAMLKWAQSKQTN